MAGVLRRSATAPVSQSARPDALLPAGVPAGLPATVDALGDPGDAGARAPVTLFLTVDTEDAYFRRPHLMTGDGVGRPYGVYGILDELERHGLAATFFVNVYEAPRQPAGAVRAVVADIAARGHEVGLHTHPSPNHRLFDRPLFRMSRAEQVEVLRWGRDRLERWSGAPVTTFRAGGYALNEDTFGALEELGFTVDSSCFFRTANNHVEPFTVNAPRLRGELVEMPVTSVLRATAADELQHRKLDLDWLSVDHLLDGLDALARHGAGFAMYMMHSFSFIEKATKLPDSPRSERSMFTSETLFHRYTEVYGPKPAMRDAFANFLARVADAPDVRVRRLVDARDELRAAAIRGVPDVVPVAWPA